MSEVFNQPSRQSAHLISEMKGVSKDNITLSGGSFVFGEVLGLSEDGATHIKLSLDSEATEGTEAVGVSFVTVDASEEDQPGLAHTRICAVRADKLVWPTDTTDTQKAAFITQLVERGVIPR